MLLLLEINFLHLVLPVALLLAGWPPPLPRTHPFHRGEGGWCYDHEHGRGGGGGTRNLEHIYIYVQYVWNSNYFWPLIFDWWIFWCFVYWIVLLWFLNCFLWMLWCLTVVPNFCAKGKYRWRHLHRERHPKVGVHQVLQRPFETLQIRGVAPQESDFCLENGWGPEAPLLD